MIPPRRLLAAALILLAACTTPAPPPSGTPTAGAPTPTPIAGSAFCTADELSLTAGLAGGAAGTSYLEVQVVRQDGDPCVILRWPEARIVDAAGNEMVATQPSTRPEETATLGEQFTFNLGWSSWCAELPERPYVLEAGLTGDGETLRLELPDSYGPSGCLGAESTLTFEPAS